MKQGISKFVHKINEPQNVIYMSDLFLFQAI